MADAASPAGGMPLTALVGPDEAREALRDALLGGFDPAAAVPRAHVRLTGGELLLMPAELGGFAGVKIAGVAPGNPALGLPRITGLYLLFDAATLRPVRIFDGAALTLLRTAAVSALAVDLLAAPGAEHLLLFGTGPQTLAHAEAVARVRDLRTVEISGRDPGRVAACVERARAAGLPARAATPGAVGRADVVACCTSAAAPLFDGRELREHATVVAMGSHTPHARETDTATVARASVFVEDPDVALREAGDLIIPLAEGAITADSLTGLARLVRGTASFAPDRPRLFKSVGMGWEDLAVAARAHLAAPPDPAS